MNKQWYSTALLWLNEKGMTVLVGHYGFALRTESGWIIGIFQKYEPQPVKAYRSFPPALCVTYPSTAVLTKEVVRSIRHGAALQVKAAP